ncbi:MAG: YbhB/YbcL family Raf kinase inhibitor-like protein [bacterium]|nr:YbhB/YbcL family Raf kinase inhibitor-like protein [bacterium]
MKLTSNSFRTNQSIPPQYTCDGSDRSPHLAWSEIPSGTRSFAVSCLDPDAPGGGFIHWLLIDIPLSTTEIPENAGCPTGAKEIENDFGKKPYGGPCPPQGEHRYVFTVYALKAETLEGVGRQNFLDLVKQNMIASAELIGRYAR